MRSFRVLVLALPFLFFVACGEISTEEDRVGSVTEMGGSLALIGETLAGETVTADRDSCSAKIFSTCALATSTKVRSFSPQGGDTEGCTRGNSSPVTVFGKSIWSFSLPSCGYATVGALAVRTFSNHYYTDAFGKRVLIYSGPGVVSGETLETADLIDYQGVTRMGGMRLENGTPELLHIPGVHRRLIRSGNFGFWYTLFTGTGAPLQIMTVGAEKEITGGTLVLANNRTETLTTFGFSAARFRASCCYPVSGTVTASEVGASNATTHTLKFSSTCGSVTIDNTSTTLPGCGS